MSELPDGPSTLDVEVFDALPAAQAQRLLMGCCAAPRWAREVVAGRPYRCVEALQAAAAAALTDDDVADGLAGHPRIGERTGDARSRREQAGVAGAGADVLAALAAGNRAYEERFGRVYLVCAAGRSAEDLLAVLRERLQNDRAVERAATRAELVEINRLRIDSMLEGVADTSGAASPSPVTACRRTPPTSAARRLR